jgi:hypothetical protein
MCRPNRHAAKADSGHPGHCLAGPVRRLAARRFAERRLDHPLDHRHRQRRLVAKGNSIIARAKADHVGDDGEPSVKSTRANHTNDYDDQSGGGEAYS